MAFDFEVEIDSVVEQAHATSLHQAFQGGHQGYAQAHTVERFAQSKETSADARVLAVALDAAFEDIAWLLGISAKARAPALTLTWSQRRQIPAEIYGRIHDRWDALEPTLAKAKLSLLSPSTTREGFLEDVRDLLEIMDAADDDGGDGDILSSNASELVGRFQQSHPKRARAAARPRRARAKKAAPATPKPVAPHVAAARAARREWNARKKSLSYQAFCMSFGLEKPRLEVPAPIAWITLARWRTLGLDIFDGTLATRAAQDLATHYGLAGFVPFARDARDVLWGAQGTRFVSVEDGVVTAHDGDFDGWLAARADDPPPEIVEADTVRLGTTPTYADDLTDSILYRRQHVLRLPRAYVALFARRELAPIEGEVRLGSWDRMAAFTEQLGAERVGPFFPFALDGSSTGWGFNRWSRCVWRLDEAGWTSTKRTFAEWFADLFGDPATLTQRPAIARNAHAEREHAETARRSRALTVFLAGLLRELHADGQLPLVAGASFDAVVDALGLAVDDRRVARLEDLDGWLLDHQDVEDVLFSQAELQRRAAALMKRLR